MQHPAWRRAEVTGAREKSRGRASIAFVLISKE